MGWVIVKTVGNKMQGVIDAGINENIAKANLNELTDVAVSLGCKRLLSGWSFVQLELNIAGVPYRELSYEMFEVKDVFEGGLYL